MRETLIDSYDRRIATLEQKNAKLEERILKLEGANDVMNKRIIEFMDHYARDFDNRVGEAIVKRNTTVGNTL